MLSLRHYKPCDAADIASWIRDEYAQRQWSADRFGSFPITAEDINDKYNKNNGDCTEEDNFYPFTAVDESGAAVGHLIMRYTDVERKVLRFGFVIVDDHKRGKGNGKEMLRLALRYAFDIYGADKVTLGVFENNPAAYHCYKAVGFRESSAKDALYYDCMGERWKCIELEITNAEHQAIKTK